MKTLVIVVIAALAINFLALAGGAGWLWQSGHLNRDRAKAIRELLFPPTTESTTQPALAAAAVPSASSRLEELLAKHIGVRSAAEQVEFLQQTFDAQMGQLDQRQRQLEDLQRLVSVAQVQLRDDRAKLETDRQSLAAQQQQATRLANDQGFQDSLTLYNSLPPKQVKSIFLAMDDNTVVDYLRAMPPRSAAKVLKEFKSPEELDRVHRLMDRMRDSDPTADPTTNPAKVP